MATRSMTREESKALTRRRLIEAALKLMGDTDGAIPTATAIAREAGVAQPTFYVHFRDRDDLMRAVGESRMEQLRRDMAKARRMIDFHAFARDAAGTGLVEALRWTIETTVAQPALFRVYMRERTQTGTPLGEHCRQVADSLRTDLRDDLEEMFTVLGRPKTDLPLEVLSDALIGSAEAVIGGLMDGRYDDIDSATEALAETVRALLAA